MMDQPLVSVIIVVHNNVQDLRDCISSILDTDYPRIEIIVIDSASTDGSPGLIWKEFPSVKLLEYPVNVGFCEGSNRAVRLAKGEFVFFLNPDTVTPPDTISTLAVRMERDPHIGVLAPKMLFLQEPGVINSAGLQSNRIFYSCDRGFLEYDRGQYDEEASIIGACGGAMFVRKAVIDRIGLFDSRYFMYYEDLDFGIRSWLAGYKVLYTPGAVVYHRMRASGRSEVFNQYMDNKNRLRTVLKNCSLPTLLRVLPCSLVFDLTCIANHLRLGKYSAARLRLKALLWNLVMLPGTLAWRSQVNQVRRGSDRVFLNLLSLDSGYPRVNVPSPPYPPMYESTLDPAKLSSRVEPGRSDEEQLGLGWYGPEMWGETPVRWTNNYGIAFLGKPWPGPGELTIRYISPIDVAGKLLVNDAHLCDFSGQAHQWETMQQRIDSDSAVIKVTLLLDRTFNLRRDLGIRDDRILGIAVSHIALTQTNVKPEVVSVALNTDAQKAAEVGAQQARARENLELYQKLHWMEHPLISGPYINQQISGDPGTNWLAWVKRDFVPNVLDRGLSLGCGSGGLERHAIKLGICKRFDAFDISREAIEMAIQYAAMEGINSIHYELKDINEIELPESQYDIVLISSALHHSKELEHVLTQVDKSLKLGGLFAFSEFVGPSQFQWTDKQLRIINDLLALLPRKYKIDIRTLSRFNITTAVSAGAGLRPSLLGLTKGLKAGWRLAVSRTLRSKNLAEPKRGFIIKKQVGRPTIEQMNIGDPSEAIRSAEIVPLVGKYFKIIQRVDFGGTLLHMLLSDIVGNFDPDREEDTAIIKLLCYLERTLIKEGVLPSDFTVIVARSRIP